jgi:hypothetical protein
MATNANTPFGLKPLQHLNGSPWNGKTQLCYVSASYATALFVGDPVDLDTADSDKEAAIRSLTVIKAAIAGPCLGVIVGIPQELVPVPMFSGAGGSAPNLNLNYLPASTGGFVYVTMDQGDIVYEVQGDGYAVPSLNWIGWNADLIFTLAGSTVTGLSGVQMDTGTTNAPATTNTFGWHIIGTARRPDNDVTLKYAKFLVTNNNIRLGNQIAGIGT